MKHEEYKFISEIEDKIYNSAKFLAENDIPKGYTKKHKNKVSKSMKLKRFLVRYMPVAILHVIFAVGAFFAAYQIAYNKETGIINPVGGLVFSFTFLLAGQTLCCVITMLYLTMISNFERQK